MVTYGGKRQGRTPSWGLAREACSVVLPRVIIKLTESTRVICYLVYEVTMFTNKK